MEKVKGKNVLPRVLIFIGRCAGYYIKAEHIFSSSLLYSACIMPQIIDRVKD